ncbi:MAG: hypothetical protein ABI158_15620 [Edaphobacter sp.]
MLRPICLALVLLVLHPPLHAQGNDHSLSNAEVEQLRESAYVPRDRVLVFIKFLDERSSAVQELFAHPRHPGREQDTHDLLEQFTSIANELDDNLDDSSKRHSDIRKALPKLLDAIDRWSSHIKSVPEDEAYNVSRKLALGALRDLREDATELTASQRAWFAAHPPAKENKNEPIDIPR